MCKGDLLHNFDPTAPKAWSPVGFGSVRAADQQGQENGQAGKYVATEQYGGVGPFKDLKTNKGI